ncbi:MAG: WD40/YVTN/BNR-like repeat-containing protein [Planctomycetota bacterium]
MAARPGVLVGRMLPHCHLLSTLALWVGIGLVTGMLGRPFDRLRGHCQAADAGPIQPLANDYVVVYRSPEPGKVFCYSPGLVRLASGRLVATLDLGGPGVPRLPGPKASKCTESGTWQGKILTSDDGGQSWQHRVDFPFVHARPFTAGKSLYVLGHDTDLQIVRSDDGGETWTSTTALSTGQKWHQSACNVHYARDYVYLVMERRVSDEIQTWYVGELAPVLMRGRVDADLTKRENWTFASELPFREVIPNVKQDPEIDFFGVPFFSAAYPRGSQPAPGRGSAPIGWLEANVVQFNDANHVWHDPRGRTFHLWMRAHTGGTGYAAIAKVVEQDDGALVTQLERVPSGKRMLYVPCPGGQMRFHVLYDDQTRLFWLLSSQATDSMTRPDRLGPDRFNLPNNERHRLQLHFSKNMVDWCFAGLVATGETPRQARHYASLIIDGDDLLLLSRSGDQQAHSAHDGNMITLHRVKQFRRLVY